MAIRTATVTNTLETPGAGSPVVGGLVSICLSVPAFTSDGVREKIQYTYVKTDVTGSWSATLEINDDIDPAGTYYLVQEPGAGAARAVTLTAGQAGRTVTLRSALAATLSNVAALPAIVTPSMLGRTATGGIVPARFVSKMQAGAAVRVSIIADSIYQGGGASIPGTTDAVSLFCAALQNAFPGVVVTKSNQGQGGRTAFSEKLEKWATELAGNADLYVLAMTGKNDGAWQTGITKQTGYEVNASLAQVESMIRELLATKPNADVMICSGNPYASASASSNAAQKIYSAGLAKLAAAYALPYTDGWNLIPRAVGFPDAAADAYLSDGVHMNDAGHAIVGAAMAALCPASFDISKAPASAVIAAQPATGSVNPVRQSRGGVKKLNSTASTTAQTDRLINPSFTGAWTAGSAGPWTSTTVGAAVWFMAKATDLAVRLTYGAGQGVVDLHIDGQLVAAGVNLATISTLNSAAWLSIAAGLTPGVHHARVVVVSGSVTVEDFAYTSAPGEWIDISAARLTTANLGAADNTNEWYGAKSFNSTSTMAITVPFVGTGLLLEGRSPTGGAGGFFFASITVDGVAIAGPIWPANQLNEVADVAIPGLTGLTYGQHTAVFTFQAAGLFVGGFTAIDERPEVHASVCEGMAKVGETVTFPYPWTDSPVVAVTSTTANPAGSSTITPTSFLVTGTAGDLVRWRANGPRGVY